MTFRQLAKWISDHPEFIDRPFFVESEEHALHDAILIRSSYPNDNFDAFLFAEEIRDPKADTIVLPT